MAAVHSGAEYTLEYRVYFKDAQGQPLSPWHDVPLYATQDKSVLNMVVEIPRWTNAKMEIDTSSQLNPIKQDIKKGKLRFVANAFPHKGYIWNYGAFPQTWEDPSHVDPRTNASGDNDPLDVCEIGSKVAKRGDIKQVKVLGVLAMIDEGETDWKILAVDVTDPMAAELNDIDDVGRLFPGLLDATTDWFRVYKVADGKPLNEFAFDGKCQNKAFAMGVIEETHAAWTQLQAGGHGKLSTASVTLAGPNKLEAAAAMEVLSKAPPPSGSAELPADLDKWHYAHRMM